MRSLRRLQGRECGRSPEKYRDSVIKRIVGVEGDYVVNRRTGRIVRVPDGMCWLEGDNPLMSRDSTECATMCAHVPCPERLATAPFHTT